MYSTARAFVRKADVCGSAKSILSHLVSYCWTTNTCFPSIGSICKSTGYSESTVHRGIGTLEDKKIITVVPRFSDDGKQRSNTYVINEYVPYSLSKKSGRVGCQDDTHKILDVVNKSYDNTPELKDSSPAPGSGNDFLDLAEPNPEAESKTVPQAPASVTPREETRQTQLEAPSHYAQAPKANNQSGDSRPVSKASKARPAIKASAVRFEGDLNIAKILEIHKVYTRMGYLKNSMSDLVDLLCACSRINRLVERKKCRNVYGLLTYLTKHKKLLDGVCAKDEQKATDAVRHLTRTGAIAL